MTAVSELFDRLCADREQMGEEKYGTFTWLDNDTLGMAMEELIDLTNYARYTFIKLYFMAEKLGHIVGEGRQGHDVPIGAQAFQPTTGSSDA